MPSDFSSQPLRDVILDLSQQTMEGGLQSFEMRESDVGTFKAFNSQTPAMLTPLQIQTINNLRSSAQTVDLYLYEKLAAGNGTGRTQKGSGSPDVATVTPEFFGIVEEGFDMSLVNNAIRQYGSEGADKSRIVGEAMMDHMRKSIPQVFRNIYTRINNQYITYLENNIWALNAIPDDGTMFTTYLANAKRVPAAERLNFFQKLQVEITQNNFAVTGRPMLIMSTSALQIINDYLARGSSNEINIAQFLNFADFFVDNNIENGTGVEATIYLIYPGGVSSFGRSFIWGNDPEAVNGAVQHGNDGWSNMAIGGNETAFLSDLPSIDLEVKTFTGFINNDDAGAMLGLDEAAIDIERAFSFVGQRGALKSFENTQTGIPEEGKSPIIKYEILDA